MTEMFDIIEDLNESEGKSWNEGIYLDLCNKFKKLYELKTTLQTHSVVRAHYDRTQMAIKSNLSKDEDRDYTICPDCDCRVLKVYLGKHKQSDKCRHIKTTKKLSSLSGQRHTHRIERIRSIMYKVLPKFWFAVEFNNWKENYNNHKNGAE